MKNSSYYIAPVGDRTHDLPHTVASNMVKVSHALYHSATVALIVASQTAVIGDYTGMDKTSLDASSGSLFVRDSLTHSVRMSMSRRT